MAQTPSNMLPLGTKAPNFKLLDTIDYKVKILNELRGEKATVIVFICNHCPFVKHINSELSATAIKYKNQGVNFIAISSNDVENYPQDSPDLMKQLAKEENFIFPYLYDDTQEVARAYNAACTPDFYLFNSDLQLVYRGQFDDSRPGNNIPVTGKDLKNAIDAVINNRPVDAHQKPSIGCNIKWFK
jgi:peroxiredoxin